MIIWRRIESYANFKCFVLNALCFKSKQLIFVLRHGIRHDSLEINLLLNPSPLYNQKCDIVVSNQKLQFLDTLPLKRIKVPYKSVNVPYPRVKIDPKSFQKFSPPPP